MRRKKNAWDKNGDISDSALLILIICFYQLSIIRLTVIQECNARPAIPILHNATQPLSDITGGNI